MTDTVNHPPHYTIAGIECIDVVEHVDFLTGNIIKYAWRAGRKEGASRLEDLQKCAWYAARAVEQEQRRALPAQEALIRAIASPEHAAQEHAAYEHWRGGLRTTLDGNLRDAGAAEEEAPHDAYSGSAAEAAGLATADTWAPCNWCGRYQRIVDTARVLCANCSACQTACASGEDV